MSKNSAVYIKADGTKTTKARKPDLEEMHIFVEGYVQPLKVTYEGRKCTMVCNEDGFALGLSPNNTATNIVQATYGEGSQKIVGNVIILVGYRL